MFVCQNRLQLLIEDHQHQLSVLSFIVLEQQALLVLLVLLVRLVHLVFLEVLEHQVV
jgi:hypothetical protein